MKRGAAFPFYKLILILSVAWRIRPTISLFHTVRSSHCFGDTSFDWFAHGSFLQRQMRRSFRDESRHSCIAICKRCQYDIKNVLVFRLIIHFRLSLKIRVQPQILRKNDRGTRELVLRLLSLSRTPSPSASRWTKLTNVLRDYAQSTTPPFLSFWVIYIGIDIYSVWQRLVSWTKVARQIAKEPRCRHFLNRSFLLIVRVFFLLKTPYVPILIRVSFLIFVCPPLSRVTTFAMCVWCSCIQSHSVSPCHFRT